MAITKLPQTQNKPVSAKTKDLLDKELAEGEKVYTSINDYLDLRKESNLGKIMEKNKENFSRTNIFSDYVTRINSHSERSLKILVISGSHFLTRDSNIYLLEPDKKKNYDVKLILPLRQIRSITFPKNNRCLFKLGSDGYMADQLLESWRRSKLVLYLRDTMKSVGHNCRVEITNNISVTNRFNETKNYSSQFDPMLRPEFQEMFRVSEKVGYCKRSRKGNQSSSEETYLMILTDMGLLLLDTKKFDFKGFIPLLGTKLKNTSQMRMDVKGGAVYSVDVVMANSNDREILVFSSETDKQEWTTKILKIQEKSLSV